MGHIQSMTFFFFFLQIKCYWSTAKPICLYIVYGGFRATVAELISGSTDCVNHKAGMFIICTFTEKFANPWYKN